MAALLGLVLLKTQVGLMVLRARANLWITPRTHHQTHTRNKIKGPPLRAGSEDSNGPDWALTVPTSRFTMLVAADWLRRRLPVFASCSRKLVRHLCKPYWRAGWCNRDIHHAMDHRPGLFGRPPEC
jgi:hypothetical protein